MIGSLVFGDSGSRFLPLVEIPKLQAVMSVRFGQSFTHTETQKGVISMITRRSIHERGDVPPILLAVEWIRAVRWGTGSRSPSAAFFEFAPAPARTAIVGLDVIIAGFFADEVKRRNREEEYKNAEKLTAARVEEYVKNDSK